MAPRVPSTPPTAAPRAVRASTALPRWSNERNSMVDRPTVRSPSIFNPQGDELMMRPSLLAFRPSRMLRVSQQQHQNVLYKARLLRSLEGDDGRESSDLPSDDIAPNNRNNRAESVLAVMGMPTSGPIPLLECEDDDNDVDTIVCDPAKLPRTLMVDEDGLTISRESLVMRHATVSRGGVIKSGLLFKQGFGLRAGGWKVRFVVLTSTKLTLYREEHGRRRGAIDLTKLSPKNIEIMPRDSVFDGSQATLWRFAIRTRKGRVLLSAYTESELKEWLRCLHVAMAAQGSGRYTDFVVPSGTFLADRGGGLLRSSGVS